MTRPTMPNGGLYWTPSGIRAYQAEAIALAVLQQELIVTHDTGLGKTIVSIGIAGELFENGLIDLAIMVGQKTKIADKDEHPAKFAQFSTLSTLVYHGATRHRRLEKEGVPDVLLTTYETGGSELMRREKTPGKRGKGKLVDGSIWDRLDLRHRKGVLLLFDEVSILSNRTAERYKQWEYAVAQLRKAGVPLWTVGLTANSMKTDYEDSFNQARICTTVMPTVARFEERFTKGRDLYQRYIYRPEARTEFAALFQSRTHRKKITDPDVAAEMPKVIPVTHWVDMSPAHQKLYEAVAKMYDPVREQNQGRLPQELEGQLNMALRLTAGHPAAHLHSDSALSRTITATVGEAKLREIGSSKSASLIEDRLTPILNQGAQVLIFTRWANLILPEVLRDLTEAKIDVAAYYPEQGDAANQEAKRAFRAGQVQVLLASDVASKGLDLPEATYIIEYEAAQTIETRIQRFGRFTRLGSSQSTVYALTTVLRNSVEVGTFETVNQRDVNMATLLGDTFQLQETA